MFQGILIIPDSGTSVLVPVAGSSDHDAIMGTHVRSTYHFHNGSTETVRVIMTNAAGLQNNGAAFPIESGKKWSLSTSQQLLLVCETANEPIGVHVLVYQD